MFFNSSVSLSNFSGITSTQAKTVTQSCGKDSDESQSLQEPDEEDQADGGHYDGGGEPSQVRWDKTP